MITILGCLVLENGGSIELPNRSLRHYLRSQPLGPDGKRRYGIVINAAEHLTALEVTNLEFDD